MALYGILRLYLGQKGAILAFALIYALLLATIILLLPVPAADFRYARY